MERGGSRGPGRGCVIGSRDPRAHQQHLDLEQAEVSVGPGGGSDPWVQPDLAS